LINYLSLLISWYQSTLLPHHSHLLIHPPPSPTLFPYTTLFRSRSRRRMRTATSSTVPGADRLPCSHSEEDVAGSILSQALRRSRSEEHTSELQSRFDLVCRLLF